MYIDVTYNISLNGDSIYELDEYLREFGIKTDKKYEIRVWGDAEFEMGENDILRELNIQKVEVWEDDTLINLSKDVKDEFINTVIDAIDSCRFYYSNYDYGELYFGTEESESLAEFFKKYILK